MMLANQPLKISLGRAKVLSLDVFDTCLLRRVGHPTNVFDLMEQELEYHDDLRRLSGGKVGFCRLRITAEQKARVKLEQTQKTPEVNLSEIYASFRELAAVSDDEVERLIAMEMEFEKNLIVANPQILTLARQAVGRGMRVVYVSDMYHSRTFITELLTLAGYPVAPDAVFVSSEYRKAKWSGELYSIVANTLGVPLRKFVHVGDNQDADVKMAAKCGVKAYYYQRLGDRIEHAEARGRNRFFTRIPRPPKSVALGIRDAVLALDATAPASDTSSDDFWFRLGYEKAGIMFLGFTLWLIDRCRKDKLDRIVFFARDGHIMKRCFDMVCEWKQANIVSQYMYASRRSIVFPAVMSMDEVDVGFLTGGKYQTVGKYLERCGLNPNAYEREMLESGFTSLTQKIASTEDVQRLKSLFWSISSHVLAAAAQEGDLVIKYMDQLQIPHSGRVGVVDIGWWGSLQYGFEKFVRLTGRRCDVNGYYVGVREQARQRIEAGQSMRGYLTNAGEPDYINSWIKQGTELVEFLFLAPHGSCLGFEEEDGIISPVLEDSSTEEDNLRKAMRVQEGILQFFQAARPVLEAAPNLDLDAHGAFYPYAQVIMDPTIDEAESLGDLTHVEGFGQSARRYIANPKQRGGSSTKYEEDEIFWKIGYAKRRRRSMQWAFAK